MATPNADTGASKTPEAPPRHFIQQLIDDDNATGKFGGRVHTRFPPEPNGYLHIGHAKSICLNFGLAREFGGNFNLRDPVMYRILRAHHHRTGDKWCIYPMYDWAHGQSDSIERITHSICTLEFENHRPLYEWYIQNLGIYAPQQIEFARLNLTYTVMSKRKLLELVKNAHVRGWDDPRMPTIAGIRRRGYEPEALRAFAAKIGVSKYEGVIDMSVLEGCVREDLNRRAGRVMGVLRPLKVVLENFSEGQVEQLEAV